MMNPSDRPCPQPNPQEEGDRPQPIDGHRTYEISFDDWQVMRFSYQAIHLNHQPWRDYTARNNPIACAFMAAMQIPQQERPFVKLACLRSLTQLKLNPAQANLLTHFIDTHLQSTPQKESIFQGELNQPNTG